jgi:GcrA cell cycle regulator
VAALAKLRTSDIAKMLGVNPKALRSVLRRNGISLRALRERRSASDPVSGLGLIVRRPVQAPSARFGAEALADLDEHGCRWPIGDPSEPGFAFCGSRALGRWPYCPAHIAQAFHHPAGAGGF